VNAEVERPDNTTRALTLIRRLIESGDLPGDGRLPTERELSEQLSVGRRTVRRALEALEAEGLLWRRQGKGTFIGQPPHPTRTLVADIGGEADPLMVMEARLGLEPALAALCARRATGEDVDRLRLLAERTHVTTDADSAELWDGSLHRMIARIAGNKLLSMMFSVLDEVRMGAEWQDRRHRARSPETADLYDHQHSAIIDAIEARDGPAAQVAMATHLSTLAENLRRSMREDMS